MPTIAGLRGTGSFGPNERPQDFRELILFTNPNGSAPIFALTSKTKTETTTDPVFHWFEEVLSPVRIAVGTFPAAGGAFTPAGIPAPAAGATTSTFTAFPVDPLTNLPLNGQALPIVPGDVLAVSSQVATGAYELMLVTQVVQAAGGGAAVTVQRNFAAAAGAPAPGAIAAPAAGNLELIRVGTSFAEGELSPTSVSSNPTEFLNYTQIFRTTYQVTGTAVSTRYRTGDPLKNEKKRKSFQHSADIEKAILFGKPSITVGANGQPQRTTGGIFNFVQSHVTTFGAAGVGPVSLQSLTDALSPVFDFDTPAGNERIAFCGNGALNTLNLYIANRNNTYMRYDGTIRVYGMELQKFILPQGTIYLRTHPLFNTNPAFRNTMVVVDPTGLIWRPLQGRATHFRDNIQPPDADYRKGEWLTEGGLELHHEQAFAVLHNVA